MEVKPLPMNMKFTEKKNELLALAESLEKEFKFLESLKAREELLHLLKNTFGIHSSQY